MSTLEYIEKMANIQQNLLKYIDDEDDSDDEFDNVKDILVKIKTENNRYEFISFLYILIKIFNSYHYTANFTNKVIRILEYLKDDLQKSFTNPELFHIFKSNKRILLFLIEEKIMIVDEFIVRKFTKGKYIKERYPHYFQPEIEPFMNEEWFPKYSKNIKMEKNKWVLEIQNQIQEDFYERRRIGLNHHFICELIRKDLLDDFIVYMNQNSFKVNSFISRSVYETNNFLYKKINALKSTTLIQYAAFYGSIKIFNYLKLNGAELTPYLWGYAIHGNNAEIFQILEDNNVEKDRYEPYKLLFQSSIKCYHDDIANYIRVNYLSNEEASNYELIFGIKYRNFNFIKNENIKETFCYLCRYNYYTLASILLNTTDVDINQKIIYKKIHFNSISLIDN